MLPTETQWKYSNLALALAGDVVQAVSGEPYAGYVKSHILDPLGMKDTLVGLAAPDDPRLARGVRAPHARRKPRRRAVHADRAASPPPPT